MEVESVTVGYWVGHWADKDTEPPLYRGGVKEFNIWSDAPTLEALYEELDGLVHAHLAGYRRLRETVGDKAILFYDVDETQWAKIEHEEVRTVS